MNQPDIKIKEEKQPEEAYQGVGSFILEIVRIIILAFVIIIPVRVFLFQPFFVQGASMEPNFEDGQYLIVNEFGYKDTEINLDSHKIVSVKPFKKIQRQKVIIFRYPLNIKNFFIKRVIGLPGEKVQIKDGEVIIFNKNNPQGFVLKENQYLPKGLRTAGDLTIQLKKNEYFVMGDNRTFSSDSRIWGPVPKKDIIGKVVLRAWPINKVSLY